MFKRSYGYCINSKNIESSEAKNCFEIICLLTTLDRFSLTCIDSYDSYCEKLDSEYEKYLSRIFKYEQELYILQNHLSAITLTVSDKVYAFPYEFIITSVDGFFDWPVYFDKLALFIKTFSLKESLKNYEPIYFKNLYGEDKYFNWIEVALFSHGQVQKLGANYRKLRSLGYNKHHLVEVTSKMRSKPKFSFTELTSYEKQVGDATLRKLINTYIEKLYPSESIVKNMSYNVKFNNKKRK